MTKSTKSTSADVVINLDFFTTFVDNNVLAAAINVLQALDLEVAVTGFVSSSKFDHVKGNRAKFAKGVAAQKRLVSNLAKLGKPVIGLDPSIVSLYGNEYLKVDSEFPRDVVTAADRYLLQFASRFSACLLYTSPSPRDRTRSRMPSSA